MSIKHRVFEVLEASHENDRLSRVVDLSILALIAVSVLAVLLETVRPVYEEFASAFRTFEVFSVTVFSIEYVLRVWSCTENPRYEHPILQLIKPALKLVKNVLREHIGPFVRIVEREHGDVILDKRQPRNGSIGHSQIPAAKRC